MRRRLQFRLDKIIDRLHILEGLLVAYLNIDEVIKIVRTEDKPKAALIAAFNISERQAEAILELKLRQLAKLEEIKITGEQSELAAERETIERLLGSDTRLKTFIKKEIQADADKYGDDRRTPLVARGEAKAFLATELVSAEPVTVVLSERGWVRAAKGHEVDAAGLQYKSGDGNNTRWPSLAKPAARFTVVVVLPTPPFWLAMQKILAMSTSPEYLFGQGHFEPEADQANARQLLQKTRETRIGANAFGHVVRDQDHAKAVQKAQHGNGHGHHGKCDPALVVHRIDELREKCKVKHDRLGVEQGDEQGFTKVMPGRDLNAGALARFGGDHFVAQPRQVSRAQPLQSHEQGWLGFEQSRHTRHREPQQNLVPHKQPKDRCQTASHAAFAGRTDQGQIAGTGQEQQQHKSRCTSTVIRDTTHVSAFKTIRECK